MPEEEQVQETKYRDLLIKLGFCVECADGSTMPCVECGAGL